MLAGMYTLIKQEHMPHVASPSIPRSSTSMKVFFTSQKVRLNNYATKNCAPTREASQLTTHLGQIRNANV
eukprot:4000777-Amphidinium_carterae.1